MKTSYSILASLGALMMIFSVNAQAIRQTNFGYSQSLKAFEKHHSQEVLQLDSTKTNAQEKLPLRKFNASVGYMFNLNNTIESDLKSEMLHSNLNDFKYSNSDGMYIFLFVPVPFSRHNSTNYPTTAVEKAGLNLELSYHFNFHHGVLFNYSMYNKYIVNGFEEFSQEESHSSSYPEYSDRYWNNGNYISIATQFSAYSLAYAYEMVNQRVQVAIGPSYIPIKVKASTAKEELIKTAGVFAGASVNIVHQKHWFVNVKLHYLWMPKIEIGPYSRSYEDKDGVNTSTFNKTSINHSTLRFGFGVGLRL